MTQKIYVGDTGTAIILDCGQDISAATSVSIEVRKPNGALVSWPAQASGVTAVRFDTLAGTLDRDGDWLLQSRVVMPTGAWRGATAVLTVSANFK